MTYLPIIIGVLACGVILSAIWFYIGKLYGLANSKAEIIEVSKERDFYKEKSERLGKEIFMSNYSKEWRG